MKKNQRGFGAVELVLIIVVVGLLGAVGWLVYDRQQKDDSSNNNETSQASKVETKSTDETTTTKTEEVKDETADWLQYEPPGKEYKISLADGWVVYRYLKSNGFYQLSNKLAISSGTRAVVTEVEGGRDSATGFSVSFSKTVPQYHSGLTKLSSLTAKNGKEIIRYTYTQTEEPDGIGTPKDGKEYYYQIKGTAGYLSAIYTIAKTDTDYHENIEKVIKTAVIE